MADAVDQQLPVAEVYAQALYELAEASGQIEAYQAELDELVRAEQADPGYAAFMASGALSTDKREAGLEKIFRGRLSDDVLNTLLVMNRHERFGLTAALARAFELRREEASGEIEVTAISAVPLDASQQAEVAATARQLSGREPLVTYLVDAEMLGGLVLEIGDMRYDNSVRRHLRGVRQGLTERGARGIEAGGA